MNVESVLAAISTEVSAVREQVGALGSSQWAIILPKSMAESIGTLDSYEGLPILVATSPLVKRPKVAHCIPLKTESW